MKSCAVVLTLACLAIAVPAAAQQASSNFGQTVTADANAKVDEARKLRLPYGKSPEQAKADADKAATALEAVVAANPEYFRAYFNLGLAYAEAGNYPKASAALTRALELRTKYNIRDVTVLNSAGWVAMSFNDTKRAEELLLQALAEKQNASRYTQSAIYGNLGQLYFTMGRLDEAMKYLTIARDEYSSPSALKFIEIIEKTKIVLDAPKS